MTGCVACSEINSGFWSRRSGPERLVGVNHVSNQTSQDRAVELLERVASQDRAAFADLYDLFAPLLFSVALRILNDQKEAEDVIQEVFAQIWEKAAKFDQKLGQPASWATTLTRNRAIDRIRASQRRQRLVEEAIEASAVVENSSPTANESLHGREKAQLIRSAVAGLPAEQRRAIELAFFTGLTQDEISQRLREPLGTIKARIRRGMLRLRDQLERLL